MSYTKTQWNAGTAPGISAEKLNKIEDGIKRLYDRTIETYVLASGTSQTVSNSSFTKINFNSVSEDTRNEFSNGTYTAKSSGVYMVTSHLNWGPTNLGDSTTVRISINGIVENEISRISTGTAQNGSTVIKINENDTLEFVAFQNSGESKTIDNYYVTITRIS